VSTELRTWVAMRLAKDLDACQSLLRGEPVDPARLHPDELAFMRRLRLVRLDVRALDLVADSLRRHRLVELLREAA
jgi:hypothetical protein